MDRAQLASFLRTRREALQPEDVGLPRGPRRRTGGLRREEVATLSGMSTDYYSRLEQQRGPHPSEQMLAALARGLRLSLAERDHLFRLAGQAIPHRAVWADHVNPGMMRILDRMQDTPAQVVNHLGETLAQTAPAVALLGDETRYAGLARSAHHRWFTDPAARQRHPAEDHQTQSRLLVADLRASYTRDGRGSRAAALVDDLLARSPEFARLWREHPVPTGYCPSKHFLHPEVGALELHCQTLVDPDQSQTLLVFTAVPGSESDEKLRLLAVIGGQLV
ncbi:helix-turn-helix transcriptional regulator [Micromonospora sp. LAH09]|uniref:helix-turn-helix transcriptional regulator n=1 Tax=Micromonospora cabrerizensis TaxID=2911213 RepID=UPI001EE7C1B5|nr:helix-turn-helix transcriptional regulator [Micromonospora cabrerizensis]MCG5470269.1 helix-turn-helix transcriptional regulator [Micromonospora cabrerizensis]